jgi:hypothetical protein
VEKGPLRFEDDRPLAINWDDVADAGGEVAGDVCNVGTKPILLPVARLTGFDLKQSGDDVDEASVLTVAFENPDDLEAGDCRSLLIKAVLLSDSNPLDPGTYTGLLVVVGPGGFARREVSIAGASTGESLRFDDDTTLPLTWADVADDGVGVVLCNDSTTNTDAPTTQLIGFGLKKLDGTAVAETSVFSVSIDEPGPIKPVSEGGQCLTSLTIRSAPGQGLDNPLLPGDYFGLLVVTSGETSITRDVTMAGATSHMYNGVVGKIDLRGRFSWVPFSDTVRLVSPRFTVAYDNDIGIPVQPDNESLLGHIVGNGEIGEVRLLSVGTAANGQQTFTVGVSGIRDQGEFTGPLKFDQFGGSADITLAVQDHWSRLALYLALGVGAAFLVRLLEGRFLPLADLSRERERLTDAYRTARYTFSGEKEWGDIYAPPTEENVGLFVSKSQSASESYAKRAFIVDKTSSAYKDIAKSLRTTVEDARLLSLRDPQPAEPSDVWKTGFAFQLQALKNKLKDFDNWLQENARSLPSPNLAYEAAGLLKRPPSGKNQLTVGSALKRFAEVQSFIDLIDKWQNLYQELEVYAEWALRLVRKITDPADRQRWGRAGVRILEISDELFGARNADELEAVGTTGDLKQTYSELARLGAKYRVPRPDWESTQASVVLALESVFERPRMWSMIRSEDEYVEVMANIATGDRVSQLQSWLTNSVPRSAIGISDVVVEGGKEFRGIAEWGVILLGFFGGGAVALAALYTKSFGNWTNYLAVFAAGFGSQLVVDGVVRAIQRRRDALGPAPAS